MENQEHQPSNLFDLQFDENTKSTVTGMTKWAMIMVISSILGFVVSFVKYFKQKNEVNTFFERDGYEYRTSTAEQSGGLASLIITILIGLLVAYFLYQFASKTKRGIEGMNADEVNMGFLNFKNYFLVLGILAIIAIAFATIGFLSLLAMTP